MDSQVECSRLPVRANLRVPFAGSLLLAALMAIGSFAGLLFPGAVYPTPDLLRSFRPNDAVNLVVGVPVLLVSLWLARRGRLVGLLLWPGALLYALYNYLPLLVCTPLNIGFLLPLALVTLSVCTLVGLLLCTDGEKVRQRLAGAVPEKGGGAILTVSGVLVLSRAAALMIMAVLDHAPLAVTDLAVDVTDVLIVPAWILGGVQLFRRRPFGYATGLGLLFQASALFVGLVAYMAVRPFLSGGGFKPVDVSVVIGAGLFFFIPCGLFVRGVARRDRTM